MPFFLVFDPPASNGPFLIGQKKGSPDKSFGSLSMAHYRLRQVGTAVKQCTKVWQFDNVADATSHCVHVREQRRLNAAASPEPAPLPVFPSM